MRYARVLGVVLVLGAAVGACGSHAPVQLNEIRSEADFLERPDTLAFWESRAAHLRAGMTELEVERWLPRGYQPVMIGNPRKGVEVTTHRLSRTWWVGITYLRNDETSVRVLARPDVGFMPTDEVVPARARDR